MTSLGCFTDDEPVKSFLPSSHLDFSGLVLASDRPTKDEPVKSFLPPSYLDFAVCWPGTCPGSSH
jgi:hypothetical protein